MVSSRDFEMGGGVGGGERDQSHAHHPHVFSERRRRRHLGQRVVRLRAYLSLTS